MRINFINNNGRISIECAACIIIYWKLIGILCQRLCLMHDIINECVNWLSNWSGLCVWFEFSYNYIRIILYFIMATTSCKRYCFLLLLLWDRTRGSVYTTGKTKYIWLVQSRSFYLRHLNNHNTIMEINRFSASQTQISITCDQTYIQNIYIYISGFQSKWNFSNWAEN